MLAKHVRSAGKAIGIDVNDDRRFVRRMECLHKHLLLVADAVLGFVAAHQDGRMSACNPELFTQPSYNRCFAGSAGGNVPHADDRP